MELAQRIAHEPPRSLRSLRPDLPAQLEVVIMKCLEPDRDRRWQSVAAFAAALAPFAPPGAAELARRIERIAAAQSPARASLPPLEPRASSRAPEPPTSASAAETRAIETRDAPTKVRLVAEASEATTHSTANASTDPASTTIPTR